jgi:Family of unknown function (DUF5994)
MTLQPGRSARGWQQPPPLETPRLRLKPKAAPTGYVDGAWWPHSDDLVAEVPDLVAVLSVRLGAIDRVVYKLDEWTTAPRKMPIGERVIRLAGYHRHPSNTIEVQGINGKKVVLLVVPHQTGQSRAHDTMMAAASPHDASAVEALLSTTAQKR